MTKRLAGILNAHWRKRGRPKKGGLHPKGVRARDLLDLCEEWHFSDCLAWAKCRYCNGN
mgnify:CR=1 FL=1